MLYFNSYLAVNTRSEPLGGRYLYIKGMQVKGQPLDRKLGTEGLSSNGCLINERERERESLWLEVTLVFRDLVDCMERMN